MNRTIGTIRKLSPASLSGGQASGLRYDSRTARVPLTTFVASLRKVSLRVQRATGAVELQVVPQAARLLHAKANALDSFFLPDEGKRP